MNYRNYGPIDARQFVIREGGGCLSVFGLPFFCAGIFLLLASLKIIPFQNKDEIPSLGWIGMFFMSLPFIGIGGALLFGRGQIRIDLTDGRIFKESKIFVPVKTETYLIVDYKTVAVRLESGSSDSPDTYPVSLIPSNPGKPLPLYGGSSYADSREFAAAVSKFLQFPLEDASTGHKTLVEPGDADKSLKERLAGDAGIERVPRPISMRSEVNEESGTLRIRIPPPGFKIAPLIPVATLVIFFCFVFSKVPSALVFFRESHTPDAVQYFILGFGVLFFSLPLSGAIGAVIASLRNDTVVQVGPEELTIAERRSWAVKTIRIPVQEVYDIDYGGRDLSEGFQVTLAQRGGGPDKERQLVMKQEDYANAWWFKALQKLIPSKGIILKTRRSLFCFGAGLGDEELRYLYFLLRSKFSRG